MKQDKGLGLQSQCHFFKRCLGLQSQAILGLFLSKNVNREMGQICNISFLPFFAINWGKNCQEWQNLQRQTSPQPHTYIYIYGYWPEILLLTLRSNPFARVIWPNKSKSQGAEIGFGRLVHNHLPPVLGLFWLRFVLEHHFTLQLSIFRDLGKLNV